MPHKADGEMLQPGRKIHETDAGGPPFLIPASQKRDTRTGSSPSASPPSAEAEATAAALCSSSATLASPSLMPFSSSAWPGGGGRFDAVRCGVMWRRAVRYCDDA